MKDAEEYSESGVPIYHHEAQDVGAVTPDRDARQLLAAHVDRWVGTNRRVWGEIIPGVLNINIHVVFPTPQRNYYTLISEGMSDVPMDPPVGMEAWKYTELVMCLPPSWPFTQEALQNDTNFWPLRWLKLLARLPYEFNTWLYATHTIPNGDPPKPYAPNTQLCCALMAFPTLFDKEFSELLIGPDKTIRFLSMIPIYKEEMEYCLKHRAEAFFDLMDKGHVTELLDLRRPNLCKKRFGLF